MVDPYYDPYGQALDDLAGNEGLRLVYACQAIGERAEADFDDDATLTEEGFRAARERFDDLVEKAYAAFDAYEVKLEAIEDKFHGRYY